MGRRNGRRLRFYGFTDLPTSLPLCRRDPETRTPESNHRRVWIHWLRVPEAERRGHFRPFDATKWTSEPMTGALVRGVGPMGRPSAMPLWHQQSAGESRSACVNLCVSRRRGSAPSGRHRFHIRVSQELFPRHAIGPTPISSGVRADAQRLIAPTTRLDGCTHTRDVRAAVKTRLRSRFVFELNAIPRPIGGRHDGARRSRVQV